MIKYTCKICKQAKERNYIGLTSRGNSIHVDENNKKWCGSVCHDCNLERIKEKRIAKYGIKECKIVECFHCHKEFKQKTSFQKHCSSKCRQEYSNKNKTPEQLDRIKQYQREYRQTHKPEIITKPKTCPICNKIFYDNGRTYCSKECQYKYTIARHREKHGKGDIIITRNCITCGKTFRILNTHGKYCSRKCRPRHEKPKPYKKKVKILVKKQCPICEREFETYKSKYCSKQCQRKSWRSTPEARERRKLYKKIRKMKKKQRLPKWANLSKIAEIYKNCPIDQVVDHIIPLNGLNVSGLHVEWNLQYLSPEDNLRKSNKTDGTYENKNFLEG
jgi:hypothetical protein